MMRAEVVLASVIVLLCGAIGGLIYYAIREDARFERECAASHGRVIVTGYMPITTVTMVGKVAIPMTTLIPLKACEVKP